MRHLNSLDVCAIQTQESKISAAIIKFAILIFNAAFTHNGNLSNLINLRKIYRGEIILGLIKRVYFCGSIFPPASLILLSFFIFICPPTAKADGAIISNSGPLDADRLIAHTLTEACSGARGEIDWNDVVRADVNQDGREDIVIDHIKIRCFGDTGGASVFCGVSGNCNVTVHLNNEYGWTIQ